jgi:hypothetical protein
MDVLHYKEHGWVHIENVIPHNLMRIVHQSSVKLKQIALENENDLAPYGTRIHWKGLGCASKYEPRLLECYKSEVNRKIATELLETDTLYLYNDQIVLKLPKEEFEFVEHYDNQYSSNQDNRIHTVNLSWILDDFTYENGTLNMNGEIIYPRRGDIIAIRGDTLHSSKPNMSERSRLLYACVFTADEPVIHENFYREKWV